MECVLQISFRDRIKRGGPIIPPSQLKKPKQHWTHRFIAFPFHSNEPGHWTLCIAVNMKWKRGCSQAELEAMRSGHWTLLHFDSLSKNSKIEQDAIEYARHIFELTAEATVDSIQVPALKQPAGSMDCGLYPFHFLRVFLTDREKYLELCLQVRQIN